MADRNHGAARELPATPDQSGTHKRAPKRPDTGPRLDPEEAARRKKIAATFQSAVQLDREFFTGVKKHPSNLLETVDQVEGLESLAFGGELEREDLGEVSLNGVSRRIYDGDPPRIAYVKAQSNETSLMLDPQTGHAVTASRSRMEDGMLIEELRALDAEYVERYTDLLEQQPGVCSQIAEAYGVSVDDLPIRPDVVSNRFSVPVESSPIREYTVSRIDELVNFGVVPLTVLRKAENNTDLLSVQEAVPVTDPYAPPRPLMKKDLDEIAAQGPEHPGAKSFMRLACLDYLVLSLDRHNENILYDEASNTFYGIDNAMSFPLLRRVDSEDPSKDIYGDNMVSLPIEAIDAHAEWVLDDEAVEQLEQLRDSMISYLKRRGEIKASVSNPFNESAYTVASEGKEIKYLTSLFRLQFGNEAIAAREAKKFAERLSTLIELRRPPNVKDLNINRIAHLAFPEEG